MFTSLYLPVLRYSDVIVIYICNVLFIYLSVLNQIIFLFWKLEIFNDFHTESNMKTSVIFYLNSLNNMSCIMSWKLWWIQFYHSTVLYWAFSVVMSIPFRFDFEFYYVSWYYTLHIIFCSSSFSNYSVYRCVRYLNQIVFSFLISFPSFQFIFSFF